MRIELHCPSARDIGPHPTGFTIVELLLSLALMGGTLCLLLPAILQSRAIVREALCRSNGRQLGLAVAAHTATFGHFPSNGWGGIWFGIRDRGFGDNQPGGWIYNVLPFLECQQLYDRSPSSGELFGPITFEQLASQIVAALLCPEKSGAQLITVSRNYRFPLGSPLLRCARTDYAINVGSRSMHCGNGPASLQSASTYSWPSRDGFDGLSFVKSRIGDKDITDGKSHVILLGEKYARFPGDRDEGYNQPFMSGDSFDIRRSTTCVPLMDGAASEVSRFGSSHAQGIGVVYCDGSSRPISFDVDSTIFRQLGSRCDGK